MEIKFDKRIFNPIFFELKKTFNDSDIRYIWLFGGSSSSKSYSAAQLTICNMMSQLDYNTVIFRKYMSDIKDSIFSDFKSIITKWNLTELFIIQQNFIKCISTGNYVVFKGLDDSEKVKGISGFKKIIIDEITQIDLSDFKQIKKRVRGKDNQQIIGIFNPISENHWIKKDIFDLEVLEPQTTTVQEKLINDKRNTIILKTNYLDNKYIVGPYFYDKHAVESFEEDKIKDYNYYSIYALGDWGKLRTGGEYLKNFNTNYHVKDHSYNDSIPLHITFDENVNPYVTCSIWQIQNNELIQIDEILLQDPRNTLRHTCEEFKNRYKYHQEGIFIYGDATSRKQDTKLEKGTNFYTLIMGYLVMFKPQLRLNSSNPSTVMAKLFLDAIYNNEIEGINISIGSNCKQSIYDYQYAQENSEGGIDKKMITNKITGIKYQEFGHILDAKKYLVTNLFKDKYNLFIRGGRVTHSVKIGSNKVKNRF